MISPPSKKPFIVPVFIPHSGCPHQCAFCDQGIIAGSSGTGISAEGVRRQIATFLEYNADSQRLVQISFFGGNFLGLKPDIIRSLLDEAVRFIDAGEANGIRFSTRPDTISRETLSLIRDYPVQTVEIGVQSMDDKVLASARRGHTAQTTERAIALLQNEPYELGLQMMVGLPGDSEAASRATAGRLADFLPAFVRIYPTLVLKGSQLARRYNDGTYRPMQLDEAVSRVKSLYLFFQKKGIAVIRMGLQASEGLENGQNVLAGPYHPAFGQLVISSIFLDKTFELIKTDDLIGPKITLYVRPKNISNIRGQNNGNIKMLKKAFGLDSIEVMPDEGIVGDDIRLAAGNNTDAHTLIR